MPGQSKKSVILPDVPDSPEQYSQHRSCGRCGWREKEQLGTTKPWKAGELLDALGGNEGRWNLAEDHEGRREAWTGLDVAQQTTVRNILTGKKEEEEA